MIGPSAWRVVRPLVAALGLFVAWPGCTRHALVGDESPDAAPDSAMFGALPPPGDFTPVDAGLASDAFPACMDRPVGDCVGSQNSP
jgi:hypothetical protein